MISEAIVKITQEVNSINSPHAQVLGEYLIDHITEESAEKILVPEKTLKSAIDSITSSAQKMKNGNGAMVKDDVVFGWLNEYYGISGGKALIQPAPEGNSLQVNLLDLL